MCDKCVSKEIGFDDRPMIYSGEFEWIEVKPYWWTFSNKLHTVHVRFDELRQVNRWTVIGTDGTRLGDFPSQHRAFFEAAANLRDAQRKQEE